MGQLTLRLYEIYTQSTGTGYTTLALVNRKANVTVGGPADTQQTIIRLWRRGGSITEGHAFVGEFPISSIGAGPPYTIVDNVADAGLGDFVELDNDMPVSSVALTNVPLPYIWGPFQGFVLGCGDANRCESVYWSKSGNADAWPPQQWIVVSPAGEALQNGCIYNNRCFVFSMERMYELVSGLVGGTTFSPFPTPCGRGLISPWGLCVSDYIYFVAKDGVYRTSGGAQESLVENSIKPLFPTQEGPGQSVNGYEAVDLSNINAIKLAYHNGELWFCYAGATTGQRKWLIYDTLKNRWRAADHTPDLTVVYSEPATASVLLLGNANGNLYSAGSTTDNGSGITVNVRTGAFDQGLPLNMKEYGSVIFDIDPGGATQAFPITITPLRNGEVLTDASIIVTGGGRQQVPLPLGDVFGFNLSFDITWTRTATINPILYQLDILWRPEPVNVTHWESRDSSYGLPGYGHVRDGYVAIRSTSQVNFSLYGDNTLIKTIAIPSTGGARKKVYFGAPANKWKVLKLTLDSNDGVTPFRVYASDFELRIKPWLTTLGYTVIRAMGEETMGTSILGNERGAG